MFKFVLKRGTATMGVGQKYLNKLELFQKRPELVTEGIYVIQSNVKPEVLDLFLTRVIEEESQPVTSENAEELQALCDELGFPGFDNEIRAVLGPGDWKLRKEVMTVRDRVDRHDVVNEQLQRRVFELERQLQELLMWRQNVEAANGAVSKQEILYKDVSCQNDDVSNGVQHLKEEEAKRETTPQDPPSRLTESARNWSTLSKTPLNQWAASARGTKTIGPRQTKRVFTYEARPLDGIIAELTRQCNGNVHDKGVVVIQASGVFRGEAKNVVDLGTDTYFGSHFEPNQWIRIDFNENRVSPTSYSVRTAADAYPKSWVFEGSNDGSDGSWVVFDGRNNNEDLNAPHVTHNFAISDPPYGSFRFIRLRLTGKNHNGRDSLRLSSLEIFGTFSSQ